MQKFEETIINYKNIKQNNNLDMRKMDLINYYKYNFA